MRQLLLCTGAASSAAFPSLQTVKQAKVSNYLIVALDEQLRDYLRDHSFNHYYKPLQVGLAASIHNIHNGKRA